MTPFSFRNRREQTFVDEDFPSTARIGLLHIIASAIDGDYVDSWAAAAQELARIHRVPRREYSVSSVQSIATARDDAASFLNKLEWAKAYDFCERLYNDLAQSGVTWRKEVAVSFTLEDSREHIGKELERLFQEECLAYEFKDGMVQRRGQRHTMSQVAGAQESLQDPRLNAARKHFSKALRYFRDRINQDFENAIKESVCAVEAAAKELFPAAKATTLGDFAKWASGNGNLLPKTISNTISDIYAFRNSGDGIAHGAASGGAANAELAEYVLAVSASQIILLSSVASPPDEPPF